jgi:acetyl-CoA acyltransferase 1
MAALHAGIPNSSAVNTVNRQCSSGLQAVNQIAGEIIMGEIDIGIGESFLSISHLSICSKFTPSQVLASNP